jgi:acyl carrier protein
MRTERFITLVRTECGLRLRADDIWTDFDELSGWDSVYLLKLLVVLEATTDRRLPAARIFEARRLADVLAILEEA